MGVFDHILKSDQTLIKNEAALDYEFVPKLLPYREKEQKYLATCISPLLSGRTGRNLLIHGPPGIGKTAATKHVLRDLEEHTDDIHIIFLNCWKFNTTHKIVCDICEQIGYKFYQNKKTTEIYNVIASILNKRSAVFVFDEIDKVEEFDFLYFILEEIFKKSIFLITNYKSFLLDLDERIKSRMIPELIEFRQYNETETHDILKQRLDYAFYENVWDDDAFRMIAKKSFEMKPPLIPAHYLEVIPGIPVVLPKRIEGWGGKVVFTEEMFNRLQ
ncbi:MAG: AAA family ATPase, partial [Nanoarchaeota archaeon]